MTQTTPKLNLVKPGGGSTGLNTPPDRVDIDVLNDNFDKIDAAVGSLQDSYTGSALISGILVGSSGWAIGSINRGLKRVGLAFVDVSFNRTGGTITVGADGDIADSLMGTFISGWEPRAGMVFPGSSYGARAASFRVVSTGVTITSVGGSANILTGDTIAVTMVYPL